MRPSREREGVVARYSFAMVAPRLLLVVDDAFPARGRDVTVSPRITVENPTRAPFAVRLRLPDGRDVSHTAVFEIAHIQGPLAPYALVRLQATTVDAVPVGSEVWTVD